MLATMEIPQGDNLLTGKNTLPPVEGDPSAKIFVGGLTWSTTAEILKEYFEKYGVILDAIIMRDRDSGRSRGFGFVTFKDLGSANRAVGDVHQILGSRVEAKRAIPKANMPDNTTKIFVGGIPNDCDDDQFREYFKQFGVLVGSQLMRDKLTGRSRGFGFVTFKEEDTVSLVLSHHSHQINGKRVEVKRAEPRKSSNNTPPSSPAHNTGRPESPNNQPQPYQVPATYFSPSWVWSPHYPVPYGYTNYAWTAAPYPSTYPAYPVQAVQSTNFYAQMYGENFTDPYNNAYAPNLDFEGGNTYEVIGAYDREEYEQQVRKNGGGGHEYKDQDRKGV